MAAAPPQAPAKTWIQLKSEANSFWLGVDFTKSIADQPNPDHVRFLNRLGLSSLSTPAEVKQGMDTFLQDYRKDIALAAALTELIAKQPPPNKLPPSLGVRNLTSLLNMPDDSKATAWNDVFKRVKKYTTAWESKNNLYWVASSEQPAHSPGVWIYIETNKDSPAEKAMIKLTDKQFVALPYRSAQPVAANGKDTGYLYYVRAVGKFLQADMPAVQRAAYVALMDGYRNPRDFDPTRHTILPKVDWATNFDQNVKNNLQVDSNGALDTQIEGLTSFYVDASTSAVKTVIDPVMETMFNSNTDFIGADMIEAAAPIQASAAGGGPDLIRLDEGDWA